MNADLEGGIVLKTGLHVLVETHGLKVIYIDAAAVLRHEAHCRVSAPRTGPCAVVQILVHAQNVVVRGLNARA